MKRFLSLSLLAIVVLLILGTFGWMWKKSQKKPVVFETETAQVTDIVKKTVATGALVPRQEVEIKPRVSGVLEALYVEPGKILKNGDPIAKIQIVPDAASLNRAEAEVRTRKITVDNARRELERNQNLFKQGVIAEAEMSRWQNEYALAKQGFDTANAELQIVREGQLRGAGRKSNIVVTSTVDGMVIDVPVKIGFSVTESNNFNPGTTIASVANMDDMIFQGQVDESEVGKIKEKMPLRIKVGALENEVLEGTLEYIAPKGKEISGAIQFEIKAAMTKKEGVFIRAGYSANADIVLDERKQVLALREALVQYEKGVPFVEVETTPQVYVRRDVKLGLSDGSMVEIVSGVSAGDKVKKPLNAGPAKLTGDAGVGEAKEASKDDKAGDQADDQADDKTDDKTDDKAAEKQGDKAAEGSASTAAK
jgi:HlyD family secretion protein